jgi:tetratricopeptide (TPR) repeat protein
MRHFLAFVFLFAASFSRPAAAAEASLGRRWMTYGNGLYTQNQFTEALAAYDKGLVAEPGLAALHQGRGNALLKLDRQAEALQAYEKSLALNPANDGLAQYLAQLKAAGAGAPSADAAQEAGEALLEGRSLLDERRFDEAVKFYGAPPAGLGNQSAWLQGRAEALYGAGQVQQSRAVMQQALKQDPNNHEAKQWLERYLDPEALNEAGGGSAWPPLWRSALLPGWGQAYNGQKDKALTMGAVTLGLLAGTIGTYMAAGSAYDDYQKLGAGTSAADFDTAFARADSLALANQIVGVLFYSAYAYNLFDAGTQARGPIKAALRPGGAVTLAWQQDF